MKPRPRKPEHPWRFRIIVAAIVLVLVVAQLGFMLWLGEQGMLVLVDAAVVALAVISFFKIKTLFGLRLYQATPRELIIVACVCLFFHVLVFPAINSIMPHRPPRAVATEGQAETPTSSSDAPGNPSSGGK